jgi:hypothetical protein
VTAQSVIGSPALAAIVLGPGQDGGQQAGRLSFYAKVMDIEPLEAPDGGLVFDLGPGEATAEALAGLVMDAFGQFDPDRVRHTGLARSGWLRQAGSGRQVRSARPSSGIG